MLFLIAALSLPADFDKPRFCEHARALVQEAGTVAAAEKLARERGHSDRAIWLAKKICRERK
jgi:hypothetical protein